MLVLEGVPHPNCNRTEPGPPCFLAIKSQSTGKERQFTANKQRYPEDPKLTNSLVRLLSLTNLGQESPPSDSLIWTYRFQSLIKFKEAKASLISEFKGWTP